MKKKFLTTIIVGGLICSGSTVVFAKENPTSISHQNAKTNIISNKITSKENVDLETFTQLSYSIEEMNEADSILNKGDLTKKDTYNRLLSFSSTSLDRIRSLKYENLTEEMNTQIDFISSIGDEIRIGCNNANELNTSIKNVEKAFSSTKCSNEEKENALYALNDIIVKNAKEESLNKKTLATACDILHKYANVTSKNTEENLKESSYNLEQMNYAIEEMKEACRLLDNADLSKLSNYERMIRFATASLNRSRSLNLNENKDLLCHLDWIEESGNSIRNTTASLNNLITTLREEKEVFAPYSHSTIEEKKSTLAKLDTLINKEDVKNHLNKTTIESVQSLLLKYHTVLNDNIAKETISSTTSTQVDTGVGNDSINDSDLDASETTSTEANISMGKDSSTQTDLNNTVTTGTQANINISTDASTETNLDNTKTTGTQADVAIGTDLSIESTLNANNTTENNKNVEIKDITKDNKNVLSNDIKTEIISIPVHNRINTSVKTDIMKNETSVATEIKKHNTIIINAKNTNKINKVTTPVSAVATQTDIAPVSAVATQTDIAPVSAVATQTDMTNDRKDIVSPFKNEETTNKKDEIKNIKSNKEKEITNPTKETKAKSKKVKKTSYGLLGLGLISTLICALLKKFI